METDFNPFFKDGRINSLKFIVIHSNYASPFKKLDCLLPIAFEVANYQVFLLNLLPELLDLGFVCLNLVHFIDKFVDIANDLDLPVKVLDDIVQLSVVLRQDFVLVQFEQID